MTDAPPPRLDFNNSYFQELEGLYSAVAPEAPSEPRLLAFNEELAKFLGVSTLDRAQREAIFSGQLLPEGANPIAQAYAGHQFGSFSPQLGDGRALLLGELIAQDGKRYDLQLKGSGRTPYSRNGDGKAAMGPVLREYLVAEAMHALGVPTSRALAAVETGNTVQRERGLRGAVLTRVAKSHIRIGTFQFFAAHQNDTALERLLRYSVSRHVSEGVGAENPALALLDHTIAKQAELIAKWMSIGFIHGVMNTDNMAISGETIDYGPCAFMDGYNPDTCFSSIDHQGRYRYSYQPSIGLWNLSRFAESLLPLIDKDQSKAIELATGRLDQFVPKFEAAWIKFFGQKFGIPDPDANTAKLFPQFLEILGKEEIDFTIAFRKLLDHDGLFALFENPSEIQKWWQEYAPVRDAENPSWRQTIDAANPIYIPRNHAIEAVLSAAYAGDFEPFEQALAILTHPFTPQEAAEDFAAPPAKIDPNYRTFCGT